MKILLAAPQGQTALGVIGNYCRNALVDLGNEVEVFDFRKHPYSSGKFISGLKSVVRKFLPSFPSPYAVSGIRAQTDKQINQMLLELAFSFKPDILLVLCGENISGETLERIRRELKTVTVNWFHDTLLLPYRQTLLRSIAPIYDFVFIIDSKDILRKIPITAKYIETLPLACSPDVHKRINLSPDEINIYGSDVAFVGTVTPEREKWLEQLADFDLKIWGRWQGMSQRLKKCYQKKDMYAGEAVKIYNASKIILDMHQLWGKEEEIINVTPRVFEVPACGGFLLTNPSLQIGDFYRLGEEMIVYKDIDEQKHLIRYYLGHLQERQAIAQRAYERARAEHTYEKRLKELLETVRKVA
jgi:spore maturation protein CgeB